LLEGFHIEEEVDEFGVVFLGGEEDLEEFVNVLFDLFGECEFVFVVIGD
jgi:hypothetical protein